MLHCALASWAGQGEKPCGTSPDSAREPTLDIIEFVKLMTFTTLCDDSPNHPRTDITRVPIARARDETIHRGLSIPLPAIRIRSAKPSFAVSRGCSNIPREPGSETEAIVTERGETPDVRRASGFGFALEGSSDEIDRVRLALGIAGVYFESRIAARSAGRTGHRRRAVRGGGTDETAHRGIASRHERRLVARDRPECLAHLREPSAQGRSLFGIEARDEA